MPDRGAARVEADAAEHVRNPGRAGRPVGTGHRVRRRQLPVPRRDGVAKVTGQAMFTCDMSLPDMAYVKILRSPVAHAHIVSIDTAAALNRPAW